MDIEDKELEEMSERAQSRICRPKLPTFTLSAKEVCEQLKITPTTLYRYVAEKKLTKYKERHHARYDKQEVEKLKGELN